MIYKNKNYSHPSLVLIYAIPLFFYVLIRAYGLSFTHDESLSFTIIQGNNTWANTANNHLLNTVLMFFSETLFGHSELALRLPNVLAFVIYLIGCGLLLSASKNNWARLLGLSFLLLNPFLIEFFSLARGYGISLGCLLISIYFLIRNNYNYTSYTPLLKDFIYAILFAALAVYANLALINFLISVIIIFSLKFFVFTLKNERNIRQILGFLALLLLSAIPVLLGVKRLLLLKELEQLYFGSPDFMAAIDSFVSASLYFTDDSTSFVPAISLLIILSLAIAPILILMKKAYDSNLAIITLLIYTLTGGFFLEFFIFEAKFPLERTGLFYIPIFGLFIYHLFLVLLATYSIKKQIYIPIISVLLICLAVNFFSGANFTYTKTWRYDAHTKDMMEIISDKTQYNTDKASITNHWLFEPTINYYISTWNLKLQPANREAINLSADFMYRLQDSSEVGGFELLYFYEDINTDLLMRAK